MTTAESPEGARNEPAETPSAASSVDDGGQTEEKVLFGHFRDAMADHLVGIGEWLRRGRESGGLDEMRRRHLEGARATMDLLATLQEQIPTLVPGASTSWGAPGEDQGVPGISAFASALLGAVDEYLGFTDQGLDSGAARLAPEEVERRRQVALKAIASARRAATGVYGENGTSILALHVLSEWLHGDSANAAFFARRVAMARDPRLRRRAVYEIARLLGIDQDVLGPVVEAYAAQLMKMMASRAEHTPS